jgi:hypothetical protein
MLDERFAPGAAAERPVFIITIDTEGDNLWSRPRTVETKNAAFLSRFQGLCEKYGLTPTYLTTDEMARAPAFRELALHVLKRHAGEIGMHLHAWNSPPLHPLTDDDDAHHPYLVEYDAEVMRAKIARLTDLLEGVFGVDMVSHRAGRWSSATAWTARSRRTCRGGGRRATRAVAAARTTRTSPTGRTTSTPRTSAGRATRSSSRCR